MASTYEKNINITLTCLLRVIKLGVYYINAFTLNIIKFYSSNSSNTSNYNVSAGTPLIQFY
jgi:hypothetical protein